MTPVRSTEKNGGMASGILRASVRIAIGIFLVLLGMALSLFLLFR